MTGKINLLPASYRQSRRHDLRFQIGAITASVLLVVELATGLVLNARANDTRELLAATESARGSSKSIKDAMVVPTRQSEQIAREVMLAERLRTKHRWSRLLTTLTKVTPPRVVIAAVATDPPQWSSSLVTLAAANAGPAPNTSTDNRKLIEAIVVTGRAVDHDDLSAFMAGIHASGIFASIDLKQARREKYLSEDAIVFELRCLW